MIAFFAPHPEVTGKCGGVESRVVAMDELFENVKRTYINVTYFKNFKFIKKRVGDNITVCQCNFFLHIIYIIYVCLRSKYIYCHTVAATKNVLPFFLFKKIIVDMHGILPEEIIYENKTRWKAKIWEIIERYVIIKYSYVMITVTKKMKHHYITKYGMNKRQDKIINIPIFIPIDKIDFAINRIMTNSVVYAGSLHAWQCITEMLQATKKVEKEYKFSFFSTDTDEFKKQLIKNGIRLNENMSVNSATKDQLFDIYKAIDFGFVLRKDNIVNKVACPTKLIEYICHGIIPIINSKEIGDFDNMNAITLENFILGNIPDKVARDKMRYENFEQYKILYNEVLKERRKLKLLMNIN